MVFLSPTCEIECYDSSFCFRKYISCHYFFGFVSQSTVNISTLFSSTLFSLGLDMDYSDTNNDESVNKMNTLFMYNIFLFLAFSNLSKVFSNTSPSYSTTCSTTTSLMGRRPKIHIKTLLLVKRVSNELPCHSFY